MGKSSTLSLLREMGGFCVEADEVSPPGSETDPEIAIQKVIQATQDALNQNGDAVLTWVFAKLRNSSGDSNLGVIES